MITNLLRTDLGEGFNPHHHGAMVAGAVGWKQAMFASTVSIPTITGLGSQVHRDELRRVEGSRVSIPTITGLWSQVEDPWGIKERASRKFQSPPSRG